jgi:nitronate monooxygenase
MTTDRSYSLSNPLLAKLGIRLPIIQAPMAGVSTPAMAAAVSNAGGMGSLGVAALNVDGVRQAIAQTRALTQQPFNINVFCHVPAVADAARETRWLEYLAPEFAEFGAAPPKAINERYKSFLVDPEMQAMLLQERPAVVSFHFGLPEAAVIAKLKAAGIVLLASATNLDEGRRIAAAGIDAIVAQSVEAGGHRGMFDRQARDEGLATMALVRTLTRHLDLPVIAAGGIMDGAGIAAALALGAQAAQLGTAFVVCPESSADAAYRARLLGGDSLDTTFTSAISGRPARGLTNRFTALGERADRPELPDYSVVYDAGKALHAAAVAKGNSDFAAQWAGQAAGLSRALPAAELVAVLTDEMRQGFKRLGALA